CVSANRCCSVVYVRAAVCGVSGAAPPDWRVRPLRSFRTGLCWKPPVNAGIPHSVMWILRWYRSGWSARKPGHRPSGERSSAGRSGDCVLTGRTPPH
ncbi:hypothetical protein, partial (plasmid) [Salmonella enterica subsp. enterica serovar Enteritidis]